MRNIGDLKEEGVHLLVGFLDLSVEHLDLVRARAHGLAHVRGNASRPLLLPHFLGGPSVLGLQLLALVNEAPSHDVARHELLDEGRSALLGQSALDLLRSVPDQPDVQHGSSP